MNPFTTPPSEAGPRRRAVPPHAARSAGLSRGESPAVQALAADPTPAAIEAFWDRVVAVGTPLVEGDGPLRDYTFVHRGEARRVALIINKLVDDTTLADALLRRVPGTDVWALTVRLGAGWRGTYALAVDDGTALALTDAELAELDVRRGRSLSVAGASRHPSLHAWYDLLRMSRPDPHATGRSLLGSAAAGPEAPPEWRMPTRPSPGRVIGAPHPRRAARWHVPDLDPGPEGWDVLVLLDGDRWLDDDPGLLDAWAAAGVVPPTATLVLGHGALEARVADLTCNPGLIADIVELIDAAPGVLGAPVAATADRTTIAGQSLGGLTALYAQCLEPGRFGASVCQSGSFWWPNPQGGEPAEWLSRTIDESATRLGRVHLEVGTNEWVLLDPTRRLRDVLAGRCDHLAYVEFDGGHDPACWAAGLPHALHRVTQHRAAGGAPSLREAAA
ncbi:enterochelin esterase domain-containing protein [Microbacterium thalassium]|uniref:Enterochelin esterase family protein n=1 Tax=Microbacterium thalassium TaxID=362649 RepID=A0A7X0FLS7_9MICO|nr:alpha/beta hydrolase-fold protein [Microbacterium thalassium]MBB6389843.1 enterochelin esterase family protein [Microbacterium thalassium]GLK24530.1 hypothetical protein GCM10017607_18480 [Microbacterium thalassium]